MLRRDKLLFPHPTTSGPRIKQGGIRRAGLTHQARQMVPQEPQSWVGAWLPPVPCVAALLQGWGPWLCSHFPAGPGPDLPDVLRELRVEARAASGRSFRPRWVLPSSGLAIAGFHAAKYQVDEWLQRCYAPPPPTLPAQGRS